jgi:hypothetical protein
MKNLLYKEFKLAANPTIYIFLCFGAMLLIPAYPYYVAFIYTCLAIFFTFIYGRESKDVFYTVSLPINKKDAVKARCLMITIVELAEIIIAVPFAVIGVNINPSPQGNLTGIEANVAFFGFVFIMYAIFNIIFIPMFYKTAYKAGISMLWAGTAVAVYIVAVEAAVQAIPFLKANLDTTEPAMMIKQLPILIAGIGIFALTMLIAYKKAAKRFEAVDL